MRATPFLLLFAACGGAAPATSPDAAATAVRGEYPAGPYGKTMNAIIEPVAWVLPDGSARTLVDIWKDGDNRLLLLSTGAGWCTACIEEQPALRSLHTQWKDRGLVVLVSLFEDDNYDPATPALAASWIRRFMLDFEVVVDAPNVLGGYYDKSLAPMNMIVDLSSMKILRIGTGYDANAIEAIISSRLQ